MLGSNFPKLDSVLVQRGRGGVHICLKASFTTLKSTGIFGTIG